MHWDHFKADARSASSSVWRTRWRREGDWAGCKLSRGLLLVTSVQSSLVSTVGKSLSLEGTPRASCPAPLRALYWSDPSLCQPRRLCDHACPCERREPRRPPTEVGFSQKHKATRGTGLAAFRSSWHRVQASGLGSSVPALICLYGITDADGHGAGAPPQQSTPPEKSPLHSHTTTARGAARASAN